MSTLCVSKAMDKARELISNLEQDRAHAIAHENFGKAAVIDGEIKGVNKMIRAIESGDLHK